MDILKTKLKTVKLLPPSQHQKPEKRKRNENKKNEEKKNVSTILKYFEAKTNSEKMTNNSTTSTKSVNLMLEKLSTNTAAKNVKPEVTCDDI